MKTKEELNALKEEVVTLRGKLAGLTEEELALVTGGSAPDSYILGKRFIDSPGGVTGFGGETGPKREATDPIKSASSLNN